jgi:pyruvate formate lyase activating enzyme
MITCKKCGKASEKTAKVLSLCAKCIREANSECLTKLKEVHSKSREKFGLPASPPCAPEGTQCRLCQNNCLISNGQRGYCGVRRNENGHLMGGTPKEAVVSWYYDPLPTNCVADWVCAGGTGAGYPKWAYQPGTLYGLGSAVGVYLVGSRGKQTGSFLLTLAGGLIGGLVTVFLSRHLHARFREGRKALLQG